MPQTPSRMACRVSGTECPSALIVPAPVITTRFISALLGLQPFDARDDAGHGRNIKIRALRIIGVEGHRDVKGLFDGKNAFHHAQ